MAAYLSICVAVFASVQLTVAASDDVAFLDQGFQFDYTPSGEPVPIPTTVQCDTIPLEWGRAAFTTGPNPTAPYYIQVYTSTFLFPSVINVGEGLSFDWPVPYVPGTQYQICMFDSNGVSGGCERMTTVIPAANSSLADPPICTNLTFPAAILDVEGHDHTGTLSQYGWIDQCTDISIKPLNGTPPFTLTVAPSLHPPWNITSNDMSAINWTVQLSWGSPFFISLFDSNGLSWAFGPLHSGGQGPTGCLALGAISSEHGISSNVAVGSGLGGLVLGLITGGLAAWFVLKRRRGPYYDTHDHIYNDGGKGTVDPFGSSIEDTANYSALPVTPSPATPSVYPPFDHSSPANIMTANSRQALLLGPDIEVEPFKMPPVSAEAPVPSTDGTEHDSLARHAASSSDPSSSGAREALTGSGIASQPEQSIAQPRSTAGQVYVVHHDGGRAPVTVYTPEGTEVIELPPRYDGNSSDTRPFHQRRQNAGGLARKSSRALEQNSAD